MTAVWVILAIIGGLFLLYKVGGKWLAAKSMNSAVKLFGQKPTGPKARKAK